MIFHFYSIFYIFRSHRLNFRYGVSGTPTILLWVNGMSVARMSNKKLDLESIKALIATHTDLVENKNGKNNQSFIPVKLENVGYEVKGKIYISLFRLI